MGLNRLAQWLQTLDKVLVYRKTAASFASIDLTVQHMNNAQHFWHAVITGQEQKKSAEATTINLFDLTARDLLQGSQQMIDSFTAFTDQQLLTTVVSPVMTGNRYDFILHVINHNSYHRGQIVTMARFLGVVADIPETDYEAFLWFEKAIE